MPASSAFEAICVRLTSAREQVVILNIYRPGSEKPSAQFFDELTAVLETLVINACPVVIGGDFNVRLQLAADPDSRRLSDVLSSFNMMQRVSDSTHRCGNTRRDVRRLSTERRYRRPRRHRLRPRTRRLPPDHDTDDR